MPTKTWEPPPRQSDTGTLPRRDEKAEPRNFAPGSGDGGWNPDAPSVPELDRIDDVEINMHGSER